MAYDRIDPIGRSLGPDVAERIAAAQRVVRDGAADEHPDREPPPQPPERDEPEDDGRPHIDVLV